MQYCYYGDVDHICMYPDNLFCIILKLQNGIFKLFEKQAPWSLGVKMYALVYESHIAAMLPSMSIILPGIESMRKGTSEERQVNCMVSIAIKLVGGTKLN